MKNLLGLKFGLLTVSELLFVSNQGKTGNKRQTTWKCICDCGKSKIATTNNLIAGHTKSCGCLTRVGGVGDKNTSWKGGRSLRKDGYISVWCDDYPESNISTNLLEHSVVMAKFLNRPLTIDENVHHKNGIRDDNRIENLELWSSRQPSGQRISDKVDYAIEILQLYRPELLDKLRCKNEF